MTAMSVATDMSGISENVADGRRRWPSPSYGHRFDFEGPPGPHFSETLHRERRLMLRTMLGLALALGLVTVSASAAEGAGECLQKGEGIGAFYVTKVAGAEGDGVDEGQELCYRCRYGSRPMVMVFARNTTGKFPQLMKRLDAAVTKHEAEELRGLITLFGGDADALTKKGQRIAARTGVKNLPVTVAKDTESGPANYRIPADADVTVVVANDSKVLGSYTFAADAIDVQALAKQVEELLN